MSRSLKSHRTDRGAVALEFVLVVPFVLMLLFAVAEFGAFYSKKTDVAAQAYSAARSVALTSSLGAYSANATVTTACSAGVKDAVVTVNKGTYSFSIPLITLASQPLTAVGKYPCNPTG